MLELDQSSSNNILSYTVVIYSSSWSILRLDSSLMRRKSYIDAHINRFHGRQMSEDTNYSNLSGHSFPSESDLKDSEDGWSKRTTLPSATGLLFCERVKIERHCGSRDKHVRRTGEGRSRHFPDEISRITVVANITVARSLGRQYVASRHSFSDPERGIISSSSQTKKFTE